MSAPPDEVIREFEEAALHAGRLKAQADAMEEKRKILFSELVNGAKGTSLAAKEHEARASIEYQEATDQWLKVRENAATWQAKRDGLQNRIDIWRTRMASARQKSFAGSN